MNFLDEVALVKEGVAGGSYAAGTQNGTGFDRSLYDSALVVLSSKLNQATGTVTVTIEESDALASGYTAISGATFTTLTTANDTAIYTMRLDLRSRRKYIRAVAVIASAACEFGVHFVLFHKKGTSPVVQAATLITA